MATITGLTAARMLEIEGSSIIDGEIVDGDLILTKHDGTTINAGSVAGPTGPTGPTGPASIDAIPGEIKLWPGDTLPLEATYGKWVWADGVVYVVATYPIAAGHISAQWRTFGGASDPGGSNFRVPDFRGLVPAGMDKMPGTGPARANRMTRSVAIILAGKTGEETHVITLAESASHNHGGGDHGHVVNDPGHSHETDGASGGPNSGAAQTAQASGDPTDMDITTDTRATGISLQTSGAIITTQGGNGAHENVQPTVFVPWIVKLDD